MSGKACSSCKHWFREDGLIAYGVCGMAGKGYQPFVKIGTRARPAFDGLTWLVTDGGNPSEMLTRPDFACLSHEGKE